MQSRGDLMLISREGINTESVTKHTKREQER
jgi:hypothetical protein